MIRSNRRFARTTSEPTFFESKGRKVAQSRLQAECPAWKERSSICSNRLEERFLGSAFLVRSSLMTWEFHPSVSVQVHGSQQLAAPQKLSNVGGI